MYQINMESLLGIKLDIVPVFNNDSRPYLPGFILRYE
jgi:hypothetical protein